MYLLDTNVLIEAHRWYYAFDLAPGYWEWLTCQFSSGELGSVSRVRDELVASRGNGEAEADWLARWVSQQPSSFWIEPQGPTTHELKNLSQWAAEPQRGYRAAAVDEFLNSADLFLIAEAVASNSVVVTRERSEPGARKRIKIPDVCLAHGVAYADPFDVYRRLGLQLFGSQARGD